jgi:hypothetical protein
VANSALEPQTLWCWLDFMISNSDLPLLVRLSQPKFAIGLMLTIQCLKVALFSLVYLHFRSQEVVLVRYSFDFDQLDDTCPSVSTLFGRIAERDVHSGCIMGRYCNESFCLGKWQATDFTFDSHTGLGSASIPIIRSDDLITSNLTCTRYLVGAGSYQETVCDFYVSGLRIYGGTLDINGMECRCDMLDRFTVDIRLDFSLDPLVFPVPCVHRSRRSVLESLILAIPITSVPGVLKRAILTVKPLKVTMPEYISLL